MSLINEALKRARIEAARRDAAEKGVPAAALPVYVPRHRRSWLAPLLGFVVGIGVFAVAAGAYWLARRPSLPGEASAAPVESELTPVVTPEAAVPVPAAAGTPDGVMAAARSGREEGSPQANSADPTARAPAGLEPSPSEFAAPAPKPSAAADRDSPRQAREPKAEEQDMDDGRTYLVEAEPPGGTPVKLDFIVWSDTRPFAQINGELINPGQIVDGYTLLTVERERVELEGGGTRFWLRAR